MQLIRGVHNIKQEHKGSVTTIGNFDGVHLGHRVILDALHQEAQLRNAKSCVISFEPLSREYFSPKQAPTRLSNLREKLYLFEQCGIDQLLCLPFGIKLSQIHADDFVKQILVARLNIQCLIVGDDFCFGSGRKGNFSRLSAMGKQCGFNVHDTQTVTIERGRISSTKIREKLASGDLKRANQLLGYPFTMLGRVIKGQQLGQKLGFPTANIAIGKRKLPISGVFAVRVHVDNCYYLGVANLGRRPTITAGTPLLEVHLLDFCGDLYGIELRVEFIQKLRDEKKFCSLHALTTAIAIDIEHAKDLSKIIMAYRA